jgi:pyrroline-5-carboxylate reductase
MAKYQLATIGAGNMAEAVVRGVLNSDLIGKGGIIAMDPDPMRRAAFAEHFGVAVTNDAREAVSDSSVVLLATKPQIFPDAAAAMADHVRAEHLLISIMAGVPTARIEAAFASARPRIVRVMPNLPMVVGAGMAGVFGGPRATTADVAYVRRIFDAAGRGVVIDDESLMDAVTAVSGSGPAYYYLFTEAIIEGGIRAGLPEDMAAALAKQACLGAARMMAESGERPAALRDRVTSKGGTTAAALESMNEGRVPAQITAAVIAAFKRGRELGR